MIDVIDGDQVIAAMNRVIDRVIRMHNDLNQLDAAMGDGDTGITASKAALGLRDYFGGNPSIEDLGMFFFNAGKAINQAASSSLGTLTATALMRAGKESKGRSELDGKILSQMLIAADEGIQDRGKAKPGDKTLVDALHPAAVTFAKLVSEGESLQDASNAMVNAARDGRDSAIDLQSKIGRASWMGEKTKGLLDPGTVLVVAILEALSFIEPE